MSFFSYLLFKCLILSSVWYSSHHYSYSMFFPPYFLSFAHRLVFSHLIKCMSPLLFVLLPLVITLPRGTGEVTVHQHPLSACGVLMYACEGKCLHGWGKSGGETLCCMCCWHSASVCKRGRGGANLVGEGEWAEREVVYDTLHTTLLRGRGKDWSCLLWGKNTLRSILTDYSFLL